MNQSIRYARLLGILLAVVAVAGCTKGTADVHQWVAQQKAKKGGPLPALPVIKTFETFVYKDQGMRDPFASVVTATEKQHKQNGPHPDLNRAREPLEAFALDSLKMVGTIGSGTHTIALIQDPGKKIHRVHVGQYMGQNYGRITDINPGRVNLVELVPDGNGGWMKRKAGIALTTQ